MDKKLCIVFSIIITFYPFLRGMEESVSLHAVATNLENNIDIRIAEIMQREAIKEEAAKRRLGKRIQILETSHSKKIRTDSRRIKNRT